MRNSRDEGPGVGNEAVPEDQRSDLLPFRLREPDNVWNHRSRLFGSRSMANVMNASYSVNSNTLAFTVPRHPVGPTFQPFRGVNASAGIGCCFRFRTVLGRMEFRNLDWEAIEGGFLLGDRERDLYAIFRSTCERSRGSGRFALMYAAISCLIASSFTSWRR